jgi:hypothetical protein
MRIADIRLAAAPRTAIALALLALGTMTVPPVAAQDLGPVSGSETDDPKPPISEESFSGDLAIDVFTHLSVAFLLSLAVAAHPLRVRRMLESARGRETLAAQILITVAGAIMVIMIGNSLARAFGLVGLGSFIRFRTVVKSPKETALLFVCIGLGMGAGLGQYGISACVTAFVFIILFVLESRRFGALTNEFRLEIRPSSVSATGEARRLLEAAGAQVDQGSYRSARETCTLRGSLPEGFDPHTLDPALAALTRDAAGDVEWSFPEEA